MEASSVSRKTMKKIGTLNKSGMTLLESEIKLLGERDGKRHGKGGNRRNDKMCRSAKPVALIRLHFRPGY